MMRCIRGSLDPGWVVHDMELLDFQVVPFHEVKILHRLS